MQSKQLNSLFQEAMNLHDLSEDGDSLFMDTDLNDSELIDTPIDQTEEEMQSVQLTPEHTAELQEDELTHEEEEKVYPTEDCPTNEPYLMEMIYSEEDIQKMTDDYQTLLTEVRNLREMVSQKDSLLSDKENEIQSMTNQIKDSMEKNREFEVSIASLNEELMNMRKTTVSDNVLNKGIDESKERYEDEIRLLQERHAVVISSKDEKIQSLKAQLDAISSKDKEIQSLKAQLDAISSKDETIQSLKDRLQQEIASKEKMNHQIASLQEEVQTMMDKPAFSEDLTPTADDISSVTTFTTFYPNTQALQTQVEEMQIRFQQLTLKENGYLSQINNYRKQLDACTVDNHNHILRIKELENTNNTHLDVIQSLRNTIAEDRECMEKQKAASEDQGFVLSTLKTSIQELKNELEHVKQAKVQQEADLKEKNRQLEKELETTLHEREQLEKEKHSYEKEIELLHQQIEEFVKKEQELDCDSDASFYSLEEYEETQEEDVIPLEPYEITFSTKEESVVLSLYKEKNQEALTLLQNRISTYVHQLAESEALTKEQRTQYQMKVNELSSKQNELISLQGSLSSLQLELNQSRDEVDTLNSQLLSLQTMMQEKDTRINQLQNQEMKLQKEITSLEGIIASSKATETISEQTSKEMDSSLKTLQKSFDSKSKEAEVLKSEAERQKVLFDTLQTKYNELLAIHEKKNHAYSELSAKYLTLKENASKAMHDLKYKMKSSYQKNMELAKEEIMKRENQVQDLNRKYKEALAILDSVSHDPHDTEKSLRFSEQKVAMLSKEMEEKKKENEQLTETIQKLQKTLKKKESLIEGLNGDINEKESKLRSMYLQN